MTGVVHAATGAATRNRSERTRFIFEISSRKKLYCTPLVFFLSAVLSVDFFLILSVQVRLSATSLSEVALKVWQAPCTLSASVGPASPN